MPTHVTLNDSAGARTEDTDPYCLREGEAAKLLAGHPWERFVAVGDSIAEGLGDPVPGYRDETWIDRIATELNRQKPDLAYLNLGRRNSRAAQVRATQLGGALDFAPDLAMVACGGYDCLVPDFDADQVGAEIRAIAAALLARDCTVITICMIDGSRSPQVPERYRAVLTERLLALATVTRAVAEDLGTLHIDLFDHPVGADADIYSADARHANRRGHAIAAAESVRRIGAHVSGSDASARPS